MTTEERLEKLERELTTTKRRNRWLLVVVMLAVVELGLTWALTKTTVIAQAQVADAVPKAIRANRFILEGEKGEVRAVLGVIKDGPGLALYDEKGKPHALLSMTVDGSGLVLADANGKPRVSLSVIKDGPTLSLNDTNGPRVVLAMDKDGPTLFLATRTARPALTSSWTRTGRGWACSMRMEILFGLLHEDACIGQ